MSALWSGCVTPKKRLAVRGDGKSFHVIARIDTPQEGEYIANGGILSYVLRQRANRSA